MSYRQALIEALRHQGLIKDDNEIKGITIKLSSGRSVSVDFKKDK